MLQTLLNRALPKNLLLMDRETVESVKGMALFAGIMGSGTAYHLGYCRGRDGSFGGVKRPKQEKALGVAEPEQRSTTTNTPFIPKRLAELSWFKEESPKSDAIPAERLTGEKGDWSISASLAWYGRQMEDEEELKDRWDQVLSSMNEEERKNTSYYFSLTAQTGGKCDIYGSTYLSGKTLGDVKVLEHLWNRSIKKMSAEDKKGMTPEWRMTKHAR